MTVIREGDVVGCLPRGITKNVSILSYFLKRDGNVEFCEIKGRRCNRGGGLGVEIPCFMDDLCLLKD